MNTVHTVALPDPREMNMELKQRTEGDGVIVIECLAENLDASNVRVFRESIQKLLENQLRVVLDMSSLKFVDSSGLGALVSCLRDIHGRKGELYLCSMTRTVRALFELMRMHRVFEIFESVDEAVAAFA